MFTLALRFWTAPVYLNYRLKINSFIAPIGMVFGFLADDFDILCLLALVTWMNFYVFWYHMAPPPNIYQLNPGKIKDKDLVAHIERQKERRKQYHN